MKAYRISKPKHRDSAFTGIGACRYGGRWNLPHQLAVYLSSSISLALLEILVNLCEQDSLSDYALFEVDVPDNLTRELDEKAYPANWNAPRRSPETQQIGTVFLDQGRHLAIRVRSCVIPQEYNLLFNPDHPRAGKVITGATEMDFQFDTRLSPGSN